MSRVGFTLVVLICAAVSLLSQSSSPAAPQAQPQLKWDFHRAHDGVSAQAETRDLTGSPYHSGSKMLCSDCHIMHASHNGETFNGGMPNPAGYPKLLKAATALEVCLSCHEGTAGIPDVVGADVNGLADRSGGTFAAAGVINPHGHNLGMRADPAPDGLCMQCHFDGGINSSAVVRCTDCHSPHGNDRARNLQWYTAPSATPSFGLFSDPAATGLQKYEASRVAYGADASQDVYEPTNMCIDCHHTFQGSWNTGAPGSYRKHPTNESEWWVHVPISQGDGRGTTDSAHWVDGTGAGFDVPRVRFVNEPATTYAQASVVSADNRVFCLSCHKAHGSEHDDGVLYPPGPSGSGVGPSGCDQCHNKSLSQ